MASSRLVFPAPFSPVITLRCGEKVRWREVKFLKWLTRNSSTNTMRRLSGNLLIFAPSKNGENKDNQRNMPAMVRADAAGSQVRGESRSTVRHAKNTGVLSF